LSIAILLFVQFERILIIPDRATNRTSSNTRSTPDDVFGKISVKNDKLKIFLKTSLSFPFNAQGKTSASKDIDSKGILHDSNSRDTFVHSVDNMRSSKATQSKFFEGLTCPIEDDHLIRITTEISGINHKLYPLASTFLLRALIERTLNWCIEKYDLKKILLKEFHLKASGHNHRHEPGLEFVINFCISNCDKMFNVDRIKHIMGQWKQVKEIADLIIHCSWVVANPSTVEHATKFVRPLIEKIFRKEVLK